MTSPKMKNISKAIILCGGRGTRMGDLTSNTPKPLVTVGGEPLVLWVMRHLYSQGVREFYLMLGYRGGEFKNFFRDYMKRNRSMVFTKYGYSIDGPSSEQEDWTVHLVESGLNTNTAGRIAYAKEYFSPGEQFIVTYGDSLSNVNLSEVEKLHYSEIFHEDGSAEDLPIVTFTGIPNRQRFGIIDIDDYGRVLEFSEKSVNHKELINGGFMITDYDVFNLIDKNSGDYSKTVLTDLANSGKARAYYHDGFWSACDSQRDREELEDIFNKHPEYFAGA